MANESEEQTVTEARSLKSLQQAGLRMSALHLADVIRLNQKIKPEYRLDETVEILMQNIHTMLLNIETRIR